MTRSRWHERERDVATRRQAGTAIGDATWRRPQVEHGELVELGHRRRSRRSTIEATNSVTEPAKVMRIGSMVKQLLDEVRQAPLDEASRERLAEIYERSVTELSGALSPDLQEELRSLALPFRARRRAHRS